MDSTSIKGVFVGYSLSSKAYRIYIKEGRLIEVRRDVIFDENQAYKKTMDIPVDSDNEEVPVFEEEEAHHENSTTNIEEGPSEPIQSVVVPIARKR